MIDRPATGIGRLCDAIRQTKRPGWIPPLASSAEQVFEWADQHSRPRATGHRLGAGEVGTQIMVRELRIILVCGSLCLPACNTDPIGKTYAVKGKVYLDGALLKAGSVGFFPVDREGAPAFEASGKIKEDGTYELSSRGQTGALLGRYKVTVVLQTKVEPNRAGDVKSLVPKKYTNKETTPLKMDVIEEPEDGRYDLKMTSNLE
jgi:hypothetical protein